ncbi:unnamed protein product [Paramecium pentaurelia]|uniref:J domain-containing protein n=1 Tax=Paramecium pentaurelia TaxID=43138 RepID=A0A8S1TQK0_9CILI|nr:unnamed protein product [Paramecium pentaurelia]
MQNPYQSLGLPENATFSQIKEQYRELSKVFHPDKQSQENYNLSVETFEKIDQAYKIIGNEFNKLVYDNFGFAGVQLLIENKQHFELIEWEFHQGKNVIENIRVQLLLLKLEEEELNSYSTLKSFLCEASFQNTFICTTNQNQRCALIQQILQLPRWKQFEFALKSEINLLKYKGMEVEVSKNYLITALSLNLPLIKGCGIEIQQQLPDFQIDQVTLKKKNALGEIHFNLINNEQGISPQIVAAIGKDQTSIQITFDAQEKQLNFDKQLSERLTFQGQIKHKNYNVQLSYQVVKEQNYGSSLRLCYFKNVNKSLFLLSSDFKAQYNHLRFDWQSTLSENNQMSIIFTLRKINSSIRFPFAFQVQSLKSLLFWMIGPQILPLIWQKNLLNPWNDLQNKKRSLYLYKIEEYQKFNEETRKNIEQADNFQKQLKFETDQNGLIIQLAYAGELGDINQFILNKVPNKFLSNIKEQLQAEILDSGLFIPPNCIDKLDGFFKVSSKKNSSHYWGYVEYIYKGKHECKKWNWSEPLSIGNVCKQNQYSIIETILGYIYK